MIDRSIGALQDAQQAIRLVRLHAVEWGLDPRRIGIMGFSAGGHLAAMEATHFMKALIPDPEHTSLRPDFLILGYPVITCMDTSVRHGGSCEQLIGKHPTRAQMREFSAEWQVTDSTPPGFLVQASDDNGVPPANSILFYEALLSHHVPAELHLYEHSGHGFGMHLKNTSEDWMGRCFHWMEANGWMKAAEPVKAAVLVGEQGGIRDGDRVGISGGEPVFHPLQQVMLRGVSGTEVIITDGNGIPYLRMGAMPELHFLVQGALGRHVARFIDTQGHTVDSLYSFDVDAGTSLDDGGHVIRLPYSTLLYKGMCVYFPPDPAWTASITNGRMVALFCATGGLDNYNTLVKACSTFQFPA